MHELYKDIGRKCQDSIYFILFLIGLSFIFFVIPHVSINELVNTTAIQILFYMGLASSLAAILKCADASSLFINFFALRKTIREEKIWIPKSSLLWHALAPDGRFTTKANPTGLNLEYSCDRAIINFASSATIKLKFFLGGSRNPCRIAGLEVCIEDGRRTVDKKVFSFSDYTKVEGTLLNISTMQLHSHDYGVSKSPKNILTAENFASLRTDIYDFAMLVTRAGR